jgi:hypothetical protein
MDKSKAVAILFVGCFLLYLGVFGTSGFGMLRTLTLTSGFTDRFDTLDTSRWNPLNERGGTVSVTGGLLVFSAPYTTTSNPPYAGGELATKDSYQLSEADISIDVVAENPVCEASLFLFNEPWTTGLSGGTSAGHGYMYSLLYYPQSQGAKVGVRRQSETTRTWLTSPPVGATATGTLKISIHSGQISFYFNSVKVYSETWAIPSTACYIVLAGFDPVGNGSTVQLDNFSMTLSGGSTYSAVTISVQGQGTTSPTAGQYMTSYLVGDSLTMTATPASGWAFDYMTRNGITASSMTLTSLLAIEQIVVYFKTGSPTTGALKVFASYNGAYVAAFVTVSGPQSVTGTTTTDGNNPLTFTLTAGTYIVSGTYSSGSASPVTVTATAGGTVSATLNFGGTPITPPNNILQTIIDTINSAAVRTLFTMVGVVATGIGVIGLFTGRKKSSPSYSPLPYW